MKFFVSVIFSLLLITTTIFSQKNQFENDSLYTSMALMHRGIEVIRYVGFEQGEYLFRESLKINPYNKYSLLCLKIVNNLNTNHISKNEAFYIIESLRHYFNLDLESALVKIQKLKKEYFPVFIVKALIFNRMKENKFAEDNFSKAINLDKQTNLSLIFRGTYFTNDSLYNNAFDDFKKAIEIDSSNASIYQELGKISEKLLKYDSAFKYYNKAIKIDTFYTEYSLLRGFYFRRGLHSLEYGMFKEAKKDFDKAVSLENKDLDFRLYRAIANRKLEFYDESLNDLNYVIKKDSNRVQAYYNRALTFEDIENFESSIKDLQISLFLRPDDPRVLYKTGEIFFKMKDYNKSIFYFKDALKNSSTNYYAYYWMGLAYENIKNKQEAINSYTKFLQLSHDSDYRYTNYIQKRLNDLK